MKRISPVKLVAALAAVLLAVIGYFLANKLRAGAEDMFSRTKLSFPTKTAPPARPAEVSAQASGVRVIPIGVAASPAPASAPRSGGK